MTQLSLGYQNFQCYVSQIQDSCLASAETVWGKSLRKAKMVSAIWASGRVYVKSGPGKDIARRYGHLLLPVENASQDRGFGSHGWVENNILTAVRWRREIVRRWRKTTLWWNMVKNPDAFDGHLMAPWTQSASRLGGRGQNRDWWTNGCFAKKRTTDRRPVSCSRWQLAWQSYWVGGDKENMTAPETSI